MYNDYYVLRTNRMVEQVGKNTASFERPRNKIWMKSTRYVQVWMQHVIVQTLVICIDLFVSGFAIFDLFAAVYDLNCVCVLTFH